MSLIEPTTIAHTKKKLAKLLIYCLLFLAGGIWMLSSDTHSSNSLLNTPAVKNTVAILAIGMSVTGLYLFSKQFFDKSPALILDSQGLTDHSSANTFGLIPWSDIVEVYPSSVQASIASKQHFITVVLEHPEQYISRATNPIKRKLLETNAKHYGSPVHISTNALDTTDKELLALINEYLLKYKRS